jgi:hypothetical protein
MDSIDAVAQYSLRPSLALTWADSDGAAFDLTNGTVTGTIRGAADYTTRAIAGTITVTGGSAGTFRWDLAAADVADAGRFTVQFVATWQAGISPAYSVPAAWQVIASQKVGA